MLDQCSLPWFAELNRGLTDALDETNFNLRIARMLAQLDQLATEIVNRATAAYPELNGGEVMACVTTKPSEQHASMLFALTA